MPTRTRRSIAAELPDNADSTAHKRKFDESDHVSKPLSKKRTKGNTTTAAKQASKKVSSKKVSSEKANGLTEETIEAGAKLASNIFGGGEDQSSPSKRSKANPYNLSPGASPYPAFPHPTPEECEEVNAILQKAHGKVSAPKSVPQPNLNSSGCGEVPNVLDALVRTRLSANTNNQNSSRAFRGLVEKFGILQEGSGKGSVDWSKVRKAPLQDLFEAIKTGGLAGVKSKDIKAILDLVHEENRQQAKLEGNSTDDIPLSLDHLHGKSSEEAFDQLLSYPGIGPKTASCVLLFCLQRPSFAVDTHIFRLTKWLGWMPTDQQVRGMARKGQIKQEVTAVVKKEEVEDGAETLVEKSPSGGKVRVPAVSRETAYSHLDVRIPDHLKYPLHYLLIRHGKDCGWCSAKAGAAQKVGTCPLAHLMSGKGRRKGGGVGVMKDGDDDLGDDADEGDTGSESESVKAEDDE